MKKNVSQHARILAPTPANIALVAQAILNHEVVGMPTETVYGLAGNGFSPLAIERIFAVKGRPKFDPLIYHLPPLAKGLTGLIDLQLIQEEGLSPTQLPLIELLIRTFWPGPLTLVLPKHPKIPLQATSELPTVAIRCPSHPVALSLLQATQTPLVAPSANRFGSISPTSAQDVALELGERIEYILDGGPCTIGVESTIVSFAHGPLPMLLRPGGIAKKKIETLLQTPLAFPLKNELEKKEKIWAPGMLDRHYAPKKTLRILPRPFFELSDSELLTFLNSAIGELSLSPLSTLGILLMAGEAQKAQERLEKLSKHSAIVLCLDPAGDLIRAAHNLFHSLRKLDSSPADLLLADPCLSTEETGPAINDRLLRASTSAET